MNDPAPSDDPLAALATVELTSALRHTDNQTANDRARLEAKRYALETDRIAQEMDMRKDFAQKTFDMVKAWLVFVGVCILLSLGHKDKLLSDTVIVTLITTSLATVIALYVIVLKYLFPNK